MKTISRVYAVLGFLMLLSIGLKAQDMEAHKRSERTPEQRAARQTVKMTETLKLNEEQTRRVKEINLRYAQQAQQMREAMRAELKSMHQNKDGELKAVLTEAQYQQLQQIHEDRKEKVKTRTEERRRHKGHSRKRG